MKKPRILMLSPVIPADDKGIRKRCAMHVHVLSRFYEVDMLVVTRSIGAETRDMMVEDRVLSKINSLKIYWAHGRSYRRWRFANSIHSRLIRKLLRGIQSPFAAMSVDQREASDIAELVGASKYKAMFCFRLSMGVVGASLMSQHDELKNAQTFLDFDDIESLAKNREALALREKEGKLNTGFRKRESRQLARIERELCRKFKHVFVCSEVDRKVLLPRCASRVVALPNAVDISVMPSPGTQESAETASILFVGSMDHGPNLDGINFFISEVLPLIRSRTNVRFRVDIVGRHMPKGVRDLSEINEVNTYPDVAELSDFYKRASIVVAPIRYGGGTRLKIVEAFAYSKPVVSTHVGAEGILVTDKKNIILADSPMEFANSCIRLLEDSAEAEVIGREGLKLYKESYTFDAVSRIFDAIVTHV